jgi:hypothetical protein
VPFRVEKARFPVKNVCEIGDGRKRRVEDAGLAFVSIRNLSERIFGGLLALLGRSAA